MGKSDIAVKQWLGKKERFADLFNGTVFQGRQVVLAEELEETAGESSVLTADKDGREKGIHRYRDIVMRWKKGATLAILACEDQEKVHYAMPVRMLLYDGLSYTEQVRNLWDYSKDAKDKITGEEVLSRFRKGDCIYPVISLVFYYGDKVWDGSRELFGMFRLKDLERERNILERYVTNYKINLVQPENMGELTCFQTDLQIIFGMLQCRKDKEKLLEYMYKNEEYFRHTDVETYRAVSAFLSSEKQLRQLKVEDGKEELDMCKALQDLYEDGVSEGRSVGVREGETRFATLTLKLMEENRVEDLQRAAADQEYRNELYREWKL